MDTEARTNYVLRYAQKLVSSFERGVISKRELINGITTEIADHKRADLAKVVLELLPEPVVEELKTWTNEVLQPDYRFDPIYFGGSPSEEFRERLRIELVLLATRFHELFANTKNILDTPSTN